MNSTPLLTPPPEPNHTTKPFHLVVFLRHVGCPFAEHTVRFYRQWAASHAQVHVTAISHGSPQATERWLRAMGGAGSLDIRIDQDRTLYRQWGLHPSGLWHFAGPRSLAGVVRLWFKGIFNRPASGTRWQRAGVFLLNQERQVVWAHVPESAEGFACPPETLLAAHHAAEKGQA